MSAVKHTPGPWFVNHVPTSAGSAFRIGNGADKGCAWIYADQIRKGIDDELPRAQELAANARLIAAAPTITMQAAAFTYTVERFMRAGDGSDPRVPPTETEVAEAMYALRAAIAKAEGRTE